MSILSNTKAQANKVYIGLKQTPFAKGIKNTLYEEGLINKSQKKVLSNIKESSTKLSNGKVSAVKSIEGEEMAKKASHNIKTAQNGSFDKIDDKTSGYISKRLDRSSELGNLEDEAIRAKAGYIASELNEDAITVNEDRASSLIAQAAKQVDGQLTFMTPIEAAKEYYGNPMGEAFSSFMTGDIQNGLAYSAKSGARIGATALAVGGAGAVAKGTTRLTASAIDKARGNSSNER